MANNYQNVQPIQQPTMDRLKKLFRGNRSVLRELQYEMLGQTDTSGYILDFGGGDNADYRNLLKCSKYDSINIDPGIKPTWVVGIDEKLPCPAAAYDKIVSMNTFEHIYNARLALEQVTTALKPGGTLIFAVPYLFRIHGHPDDYNRFTISWWSKTLEQLGYEDIKIYINSWGPYSTGLFMSSYAVPFRKLFAKAALLLDILYARHAKSRDEYHKAHALGYFVTARKK